MRRIMFAVTVSILHVASAWAADATPEAGDNSRLEYLVQRLQSQTEHVIDGAIFGYSQGTNPEAVVVIEALETDSRSEWRCQLSRLTGYAVTARRNGNVVLAVPKLNNTTRTTSFRHVYERPVPYPFQAEE
jgi:hypothetical protein